MPLWKMEQITPYFEKEANRTRHDLIGIKLVKDCLTNSEIGAIGFVETGGTYEILTDGEFQNEKVSVPTIFAQTVVTASPIYREENPDMYSYERAAKALYKIYWSKLSCLGKLHRLAYRWSLPTIAISLVAIFVEAILTYFVSPSGP